MAEEADGVYDEVELGDMEYIEDEETWLYPCPCGDKFFITLDELLDGEDIATCPSCSLVIRVLYEPVSNPSGLLSNNQRELCVSAFCRAIFPTKRKRRARWRARWRMQAVTHSRRLMALQLSLLSQCLVKL